MFNEDATFWAIQEHGPFSEHFPGVPGIFIFLKKREKGAVRISSHPAVPKGAPSTLLGYILVPLSF